MQYTSTPIMPYKTIQLIKKNTVQYNAQHATKYNMTQFNTAPACHTVQYDADQYNTLLSTQYNMTQINTTPNMPHSTMWRSLIQHPACQTVQYDAV